MFEFFKKAFRDMKKSAAAQHEVDKAQFAATRAEARANWEEAKMTPAQREERMQKERNEQIAAANERRTAAEERIANAKKNLHKVTLSGTTIPHEVTGIYGAGTVLMKPASVGTGVIAGGAVRAVMEAVGISNIRTKCLRSNNPQNVVKATMQGLLSLRGPEEVARIRGKSVEEIIG